MPELVVPGLVGSASSWLLTYLLHSSAVVGAVWCLSKSGWVRRPTTLDLLWKVALVAGFATASLAMARPTEGARRLQVEVADDVVEGHLAWQAAARPEMIRIRATAVDPPPMCLAALDRLQGLAEVDVPALSRSCGPTGRPWRGPLLGLWLMAAVLLLGNALRVRIAFRRGLRNLEPASPEVVGMVRSLLPGGRADVVVTQSVDAPCVIGGRIALPERCVQDLSADQLRAVLAHEVAHLTRRDPAWMAFGDMLCRAFWLQPLNRLALAGLRASAELVCDDWAVERTRSPMELATSIARVAEWLRPAGRTPAPALAQLAHLARGEGRALSSRVRRILTPGVARREAPQVTRLLLAALVMAPTLVLPAVPRAASFAVFIRRGVENGAPMVPVVAPGEDVAVVLRRVPRADS